MPGVGLARLDFAQSVFAFFKAGCQLSVVGNKRTLKIEKTSLPKAENRKPRTILADNRSLEVCWWFALLQFPQNVSEFVSTGCVTSDEFTINTPGEFVGGEDLRQRIFDAIVTE